jgi:hypothetical protein
MGLIISTSDRHFLHMNVLLRHSRGCSGVADADIETILTEAATGRRRIWANAMLLAELRPSAFVAGSFSALADFTRYLRSVVTFVSPDPNTMLRAARLRDVKWERPAALRRPGEQPRFLSVLDAIQLASALWVKETAGVADLEFLAFEDSNPNEPDTSGWLSLLRLQDYAEQAPDDSDVLAALRLPRAEPVLRARAALHSAAVG